MHTVFSHIIQKRLSTVYEDVATDALAYLIEASDAARRGMMKLLRGIIPELPPLRFKTQQAEGTMRPDMWGFAETEPRVFVENKFWAGLTDNQPVTYLDRLAKYSQPTALLVIAPAARQQTLWHELTRRLQYAQIAVSQREVAAGIPFSVATQLGPILALTSWANLLSVLEHEAVDDLRAKGDLLQLRALCDAADNEAFAPFSSEELSDQRTPASILQLSSIVQKVVPEAVRAGVLSLTAGRGKLQRQADWQRIGHYVRVSGDQGVGAWLGIHFGLWKAQGLTPLWLLFSETDFGRKQEVRRLIEPWAETNNIPTATYDGDFAISLEIRAGEEEKGVIRLLVEDLSNIAQELQVLPPISVPSVKQESDHEVPE